MDTPNILKGNYYPSCLAARCPRFHACTVTKKCQNYDRHLLECNICESRTNTHEVDPDSVPLGGHLPEGEYYPDLQDAFAQMEKMVGRPAFDPDAEQHMNTADIARNMEREQRVVESIQKFADAGMQMEERIMQALVDPELARLLGRME